MNNKIYCIGEILWDNLPEGRVPGGAPFNVAVHLKRLGVSSWLISAVGADPDGEKLVQLLKSEKLSEEFISKELEHPTGSVDVSLDNSGNATYDIKTPAAWDYIKLPGNIREIISEKDYVVFGSMAQRSKNSRQSIECLQNIDCVKVFDVNLRYPHYTKEIIETSLNNCDILKLNKTELEKLSGWFLSSVNDEDKLLEICDKFNIAHIILTKGEHGSQSLRNGKFTSHNGYKLKIKDTVGAGDSFLAAYISKIDADLSEETRLAFANAVGSYVATQHGALPELDMNYIMRLMQ